MTVVGAVREPSLRHLEDSGRRIQSELRSGCARIIELGPIWIEHVGTISLGYASFE